MGTGASAHKPAADYPQGSGRNSANGFQGYGGQGYAMQGYGGQGYPPSSPLAGGIRSLHVSRGTTPSSGVPPKERYGGAVPEPGGHQPSWGADGHSSRSSFPASNQGSFDNARRAQPQPQSQPLQYGRGGRLPPTNPANLALGKQQQPFGSERYIDQQAAPAAGYAKAHPPAPGYSTARSTYNQQPEKQKTPPTQARDFRSLQHRLRQPQPTGSYRQQQQTEQQPPSFRQSPDRQQRQQIPSFREEPQQQQLQSYGRPPPQQQQQQGYGRAPPQQQQQQGYGRAPPQQQQAQSYGRAPPQQQQAPAQQGFGWPFSGRNAAQAPQRAASKSSESVDAIYTRPIAGEQAAAAPLRPCPQCGRKFNSKAYEKHIKICSKVFGEEHPRKVYNAAKARVVGTELQAYVDIKTGKPKSELRGGSSAAAPKKKVPKWKQQSEALRLAMQAARENS